MGGRRATKAIAKNCEEGVEPTTSWSDQYRARQIRSEYFAKPLSQRKAIAKAQATQLRLF